MSNTKSSNQAAVPEAKGALDRFKFEVANELGVPLTDGYNGNLTSKQNGSVGGYMGNKLLLHRSTSVILQHDCVAARSKTVDFAQFQYHL